MSHPSSWRNILDLPEDEWNAWISALIASSQPSHPNDTSVNTRKQAEQLLAAIDHGGIPTDPIRINNIGRALGLEVLPNALMADTVERIRVEVNKP